VKDMSKTPDILQKILQRQSVVKPVQKLGGKIYGSGGQDEWVKLSIRKAARHTCKIT